MGIGVAARVRQTISFGLLACLGLAAVQVPVPAQAAQASSRTILVVGDSLSAELGLVRGTGWVQLLADRIAAKAPQYSVANASISGETSSGGRSRLPGLLDEYHPAIVVIELGANDGLRGLAVDAMRSNLQAMIHACRGVHAQVLLVGMHVPPNFGAAYDQRFHGVYDELAKRNGVRLVPFLLEGFAEQLDWFQADHIHPQARAQPRMLDNVWTELAPMLG